MKIITDDQIQTAILPRLALSTLLRSQAVAFRSLSTSQCPPRLSLRTPRHTQLFMPARTDVSVIKIVSVPLPASGLSGIPGTNLVFDDSTGRLSHVVDSSCLTALRTAAGSLLGSIVSLGPGEGVRMAVCFGDGLQAVFHVWLHCRYFTTLEKVLVVVGLHRKLTPDEIVAKQVRFATQLEALGSREIQVEVSTAQDEGVKQALRDAQLVLTCTPSTKPLFDHTDLAGRTHICAVGSYKPHMVEVPPQVVIDAKRVIVDSVDACIDEAGCLIQAIPDREGLKERCTQLGGLLPSTEGGEEAFMKKLQAVKGEEEEEGGVTLFKSVGVGLQDVEITKVVVRLAEEMGGVGSDVPF